MLEEALFSYLTGYAGLSALIGTRLYPVQFPQGVTLPAMTYQQVSSPEVYSHDGYSGLRSPRFQFTCRGSTYLEAKQVAAQLKAALRGYAGLMAGSVNVRGARIENEIDQIEPELGIYDVIVDAVIPVQE